MGLKHWDIVKKAEESEMRGKKSRYLSGMFQKIQGSIASIEEAEKNYERILKEFLMLKKTISEKIANLNPNEAKKLMVELRNKKSELYAAKSLLDSLVKREKELAALETVPMNQSVVAKAAALSKLMRVEPAQSPLPPKTNFGMFDRSRSERIRTYTELGGILKSANAEVHVRTITVLPKSKYGEYHQTRTKEEEDEDTRERYKKHIKYYADIANADHLEHHFEVVDQPKPLIVKPGEAPPPKAPDAPRLMKREKANHITRLAFPEFSFYRDKTSGPLSISALNDLLVDVKKMAMTYEENLHLLLATFPVKADNSNTVYNIALYTQCGAKPKITVVNKVMPSYIDLFYDETRLPFLSEGSSGTQFHDSIRNYTSAFCGLLFPTQFKSLTIEKVIEYLDICQSNPDYPPPEKLVRLLSELIREINLKSLTLKSAARYADLIAEVVGIGKFSDEIDFQITKMTFDKSNERVSQFIMLVKDEKDYFPAEMRTRLQLIQQKIENSRFITPEEHKVIDAAREIFTTKFLPKEYETEEDFLKRIKTGNKVEDILEFFERNDAHTWTDDVKQAYMNVHSNFVYDLDIDPADLDLLKTTRAANPDVEKLATSFLSSINTKASTYKKNAEDTLRQATADQIDAPIPGIHAEFSHQVACRTAGGAEFMVGVDICLEHVWGAARTTRNSRVNEAMMSADSMITSTTSHVLTSNSVNPEEDQLLTGFIEHVDPVHLANRPAERVNNKWVHMTPVKSESKLDTGFDFGSGATVHYYDPKPLRKMLGETQKTVDLHNLVMQDYMALCSLRYRNPNLLDVYSQVILCHIFDSFLQLLEAGQKVEKSKHGNELKQMGEDFLKLSEQNAAISGKKVNAFFELLLKVVNDKTSKLIVLAKFMLSLLTKELETRAGFDKQFASTRESRQLVVKHK